MLKYATRLNDDAIDILVQDHDKIKRLFEEFERAGDPRRKKTIAAHVYKEIKIHSAIEEEVFYPVVRNRIGKKIMNEADEEHHIAKILIAELEEMNGGESHYDAKFEVLSESLRHHFEEEERDLFPKTKALPLDLLELARQMLARKRQLLITGVAPVAEEKMVAMIDGKGDSSAEAAKITRPVSSLQPKA